MSWLFTGFEPFGGEAINPSALVGQAIARKTGCDFVLLPVSYKRSFETLRSHLESGKYQGLISLGQAGGRAKVNLERVALNLEDSESADCDGLVRVEQTVEAGGPHAIMNPLPLREIVAHLHEKIGPIEISSSCGTYVCNSLYYKVFRWLEQNPGKLRWQLFIHLPYLPEQVMGKDEHTPFLPQSVMEQAVLETFQILKNR
jgi:pyroglutamyl-peptidase